MRFLICYLTDNWPLRRGKFFASLIGFHSFFIFYFQIIHDFPIAPVLSCLYKSVQNKVIVLRHSRFPWGELKYALWLPIYLLAFALMEQRPQTAYWATQLPLDRCIPFCEWFVLFYCAWYPLLVAVGIYLLLRDAPVFRRYMAFLAVTFFVSVFIWLLLPNGQDLRPHVFSHSNPATALIAALYRIDTNTNVLPSVHVVGAVGAAFAVWDSSRLRSHPSIRRGVVILAALICASTLLIKQHTVLDVAAGLMLSALAALPIYLLPYQARVKKPA